MPRNTERFKKGKIAWAISTRDGGRYLHKEMVPDPVSGQYVHKSEIDKSVIIENPRYHDVGDNIDIDNPLPDTHRGPKVVNPYKIGNSPAIHLTLGISSFDYQRHLQHPERHIYFWLSNTNMVPANQKSDDPVKDFPNGSMYFLDLQEHNAHLPFMMADQTMAYPVIAYHHSRSAPTRIQLNSDDPFDQKDAFQRSNDITLYDEDYHTLIAKNQWVGSKVNAEPLTQIIVGV